MCPKTQKSWVAIKISPSFKIVGGRAEEAAAFEVFSSITQHYRAAAAAAGAQFICVTQNLHRVNADDGRRRVFRVQHRRAAHIFVIRR